MLELLGIPYTGSVVLASALAMDKARTKQMLRLHDRPTAPGRAHQGLGRAMPAGARLHARAGGERRSGGARAFAGDERRAEAPGRP